MPLPVFCNHVFLGLEVKVANYVSLSIIPETFMLHRFCDQSVFISHSLSSLSTILPPYGGHESFCKLG